MDLDRLITMEEEFYELDADSGDLKPVRASLIKKIADPELDKTVFGLTAVNIFYPLSMTLIVALLTSYPLVQIILLLVFFGTQLIYNLIHRNYILSILKPKLVAYFAMLVLNLFLLALVATLSFDNLMPFVRLSTLKFLSRVYMVFSMLFIMASFGFIGMKFKEIQLSSEMQPEESFNDLESEEVQDLVKHSINMNMNTEKKMSGFVERLRSQRNFELETKKSQKIA